MTHEIGSLIAPDDVTLFTRQWTPDGPVRGVVALVHGIHEHSGRYAYVASALMRRGFAVHALDLRGHGRSHGTRGHVDDFAEYVDDVQAHLIDVRERIGDAPLFLMGHSMGGLVVASYVVTKGTDGLRGVILSSPAIQLPDDTPALLQKLAPFIARWLPAVPVSKVDLSQLSHDPTVARAYEEDPLNTVRGVRARTGYEILRAGERVRQHPEAFDVPLFLFHGTADAIAAPAGTEWLAAHAATDDVTLRLWDGLFHETLNEVERDDVIAALGDWLEAHAPAEAA
jgi:alpha-beta hydrolase superfamily lysophospholipase